MHANALANLASAIEIKKSRVVEVGLIDEPSINKEGVREVS